MLVGKAADVEVCGERFLTGVKSETKVGVVRMAWGTPRNSVSRQ